MTSVYLAKLILALKLIDINVQKIDNLALKIYRIVII